MLGAQSRTMQASRCVQGPQRTGLVHRSGRGRLTVVAAIKERSAKQICCSKTLKANKGAEEKVQEMLRQVDAYSQEQKKDRKNGIVMFQVAKDNFSEGTYFTWEQYESVQDFSRHTMSPGVLKFMEGVQPLIEGPIGVALYEWNNGNLGPACLNEGPKGEGGLDDATGATGGSAGGASMKQTSASFDLTAGEVQEEEGRIVSEANKRMEDFTKNFKNFFGQNKEQGKEGEKKEGGFFGNMFGGKKDEAKK